MNLFWQRDDLIQKLNLSVDFESVQRVREERLAILQKDTWKSKVDAVRRMASQTVPPNGFTCDFAHDTVKAALAEEIDQIPADELEVAIREMMPWRKGPFQLGNIRIDAEWQSHLKWNRLVDHLGDLQGQRILDVGCGNGYYMFRAVQRQPQFVLGLDPSPNFLLQFELIQWFARRPELQIELLGFEHLNLFRKTFDLALCMGILYHHASPVDTLKQLRNSLRIGGRAIIESQAIPGDEPVALFPESRYAKARNVFFVPTASCLANWVSRAGFAEVRVLSQSRTTIEEQRKTRWMVFESLEDFLDPQDASKTVEGYPAPHRVIVSGRRTRE